MSRMDDILARLTEHERSRLLDLLHSNVPAKTLVDILNRHGYVVGLTTLKDYRLKLKEESHV